MKTPGLGAEEADQGEEEVEEESEDEESEDEEGGDGKEIICPAQEDDDEKRAEDANRASGLF